MIGAVLADTPWFVPGMVVALAASLVLCRPVAGWLGTPTAVGFVLVLALGLLLTATLTPSAEALEFGSRRRSMCDLSVWTPVSLHTLLNENERSLNVLLCVPLGLAVGLLPRSRRSVVVLVVAFALPAAVEVTQLLAPALRRFCQSQDVVDNVTGLVGGLFVGLVLGAVARRVARSAPRGA